MIKFKASVKQVRQIMANAYNASVPVGMGIDHYSPRPMHEDEFSYQGLGEVNMDYVKGRMGKLCIKKIGEDTYQVVGSEPHP